MQDRDQVEELRRSERRFRATFEQAGIGMAHVGRDRRLLRANRVFGRMLGFEDSSKVVGMSVEELTHPDDLAAVLEAMKRLIAGEVETVSLTKRCLRADGSLMWGNDALSLVREEDGEDYFLCARIDVTPQVDSERRLRESEELFRSAFEQAAVGMAQAGRPGERWLNVNDRFCEIVGYPCEELLKLTPRDITHPDDREMDEKQAEEVWSGRKVGASREKRYIRKDGSVVWTERNLSLIRDAAGRPSRFFVLVQDMSERKEAQRQLIATQDRYRLMFENSHEGVIIYRAIRDEAGHVADLIVEDANPAQVAEMGASREQVVGRKLSEMYGAGEVMRPYMELAENVIASGEARRFELRFDPTGKYYVASVYPLGPEVWAVMALDVTVVHRAQEELKRRDEEIRRAYEDVLDAVTGGKLALMTQDEIKEALGEPLTPERVITVPSELASARAEIRHTIEQWFPTLVGSMKVLNPVGEALNNALKHAGGGTYRLYRAGTALQVEVHDTGPGIDFRALPHSTLVSGYSTTATLGVGFTLMLQLADRVLLATQPGGTYVVLEVEPG